MVCTPLVNRGGNRSQAPSDGWEYPHSWCPTCRSSSVFPVDLVNEIVERVAATRGESRFTRDIPRLAELGGLAAALRWSAD